MIHLAGWPGGTSPRAPAERSVTAPALAVHPPGDDGVDPGPGRGLPGLAGHTVIRAYGKDAAVQVATCEALCHVRGAVVRQLQVRPRPPTRPPPCAGSSSRPGFPPSPSSQPRTSSVKSTASPGPARPSPPNSETRVDTERGRYQIRIQLDQVHIQLVMGGGGSSYPVIPGDRSLDENESSNGYPDDLAC